jgi:hypothetical protein
MKRAWTLTMSALAAAALASCGGGDDEPAATADPPAPAEAAPANAAPAAVDLSTADIETWHSYYYLDPTPDRLGEYMLHLASRNHFRDFDNAYSTGAFVAKVLEANPELAEAVAERLREVPFRQRWGFNYGLWLSGIAGANDLLSNEAQLVENPVERDQLLAFVGPDPYVMLEVERVDARAVDMLWQSFYATGDEAYIVRTLEALPDAAVPDSSMERRRLTNAARWVLAQNCFRHRRVMELAERLAEDPDLTPGVRDSIRAAIAEAQERLDQGERSPDPSIGG